MINTGIYKLVFGDSLIYIGKSIDIERRCAQHLKALKNGTHTTKLQEAYDKYGEPKCIVLFECHPDHINILEVYFINLFWNENILNSTRPGDLLDGEKAILRTSPIEVWDASTFEMLEEINELEKANAAIQDRLNKLADVNKYLADLEDKVFILQNRKLYDRILNRPI